MSKNPLLKTQYQVNLSPQAWAELEIIAQNFNLPVSELLEQVGCRQLAIIDPENLEDYLDLKEALEAEADPENQERIAWEDVKKELRL